MAEEPGTGLSVPWPPGAWPPGEGLGVADGLTQGNRPEALPAPMSWLEAPLRSGIGPSGRLVCGEAPGDDAPGDAPGDDLAGDGDAAETATVSAADGGVHFCVVAMLAVAVSLTEVTELALAATGICALSVTGCLSDTELTAQLAVPSPLRQPPVNAGFWLVGWAVRVTVTPVTEPLFPVETCTTYIAFWPRLMLACERWTLTHSSGWAAGLAGLAPPLALGLGLELGLAAMNASRVAETVADGELWDDREDDGADGEDEPVWDGEPVGELDGEPVAEVDADADADGEPEPEPELAGDGDPAGLLGLLLGLPPELPPDDAGAVAEEAEELEEAEGDGDGDGDGDFEDGRGVGVGVGVGVAAAGSASHVVSAFAAALVEVLALGEAAATAITVPACAEPGQLASTPRARDPPATKPSAAARTCARRMKTALSPLLFVVTVCSLWGS